MGGFPPPMLQWNIEHGPVKDEEMTILVQSQEETQLSIEQLTHTRHHNMLVTCKAGTATKTIKIRVQGRTWTGKEHHINSIVISRRACNKCSINSDFNNNNNINNDTKRNQNKQKTYTRT